VQSLPFFFFFPPPESPAGLPLPRDVSPPLSRPVVDPLCSLFYFPSGRFLSRQEMTRRCPFLLSFLWAGLEVCSIILTQGGGLLAVQRQLWGPLFFLDPDDAYVVTLDFFLSPSVPFLFSNEKRRPFKNGGRSPHASCFFSSL